MSRVVIKGIAITGVDGTGKSTIVSELSKWLGADRCIVQYMGLKNWETQFAKRVYKGGNNLFFKLLIPFALVHEMYHRVNKYKNNSKIIIFDRYIYEQVLNTKKIRNKFVSRMLFFVYWISFKKFYSPQCEIYLHCSLATSIGRKDDINGDKDRLNLELNKTLLDNYYFSKPNVLCIDTSSGSVDASVRRIKEFILNDKTISSSI